MTKHVPTRALIIVVLALLASGWSAPGNCADPSLDETRIIYFAYPREGRPCPDDPSMICATMFKEDAKLKFRISRRLYDWKQVVVSRIPHLSLMVTSTKVVPFSTEPGSVEDRFVRNLIYPNDFTFALSEVDAKAVQRSTGHFMNGAGRNYVAARSYLPGFKMYDIRGCEDYDDIQIDRTLSGYEAHPKYKLCAIREQVFVPTDRSDIWFYCNGRLRSDGKLLDPLCEVSSFYEPGIVQHYGIRGRDVRNDLWRQIDRQLRQFVLSMLVK